MITLKFKGKVISKDNEKITNRMGRPFLSKRFKDYAQYISLEARSQYHGRPLAGNLNVTATFLFKNRVHSDLTNLPKGLFDALNGLIWQDDRQIKKCFLEILYCNEEGCVLTISEDK